MANLKTKPTDKNILEFLSGINDSVKKDDSQKVLRIMQDITGKEPKMWGSSMIGFGEYHYRYNSGHEGNSFITGFSPRKQALTIYIMSGFSGFEDLMQKLGKYKTGKSCLYIKSLRDVDEEVLKDLIRQSVRQMESRYQIIS